METGNDTQTAESTSGSTSTVQQGTGVSESTTSGGSNDASLASGAEKTPGAGNQPPANGGSASAAGAAGDSAALGDWKPNFKFKVKDKELEFDDAFKGVIKSKDLEERLRDLHLKAHGIDEVKTSRDTFKKQAEEWQGKFSTVEKSLSTLGSFVQRRDYTSFFDALKIPKQDIINYAIQELKYQELTPEQRSVVDQQRQQQLDLYQAQAQTQTYQQQLADLAVKQANFEIDQAIAAPDVASVAQAFDARAGKQGAFREEIVKRGQFYENVHKVSPPASQLAAELLNLIGVQAPAQQGQGAPSQGTTSQQAQVVQNQSQKPTIPAFQGGSSTKTATKKVPTSVEDLRKIRQERLQQQQG